MSLKSQVIVEGAAQRVTRRSGISKATGAEWAISSVIVIGADCLADVSFFESEASVTVPKPGDKFRALCEVGVFRDDDSLSFVKYLG